MTATGLRAGARSAFGATSRQAVFAAVTVVSFAPLVYILLTSLKSQSEYSRNPVGFPQHLTGENYLHVFTDLPVVQWAVNSLVITTVSVLGSLAIGLLASYAIVFGRFRGRTLLYGASVGLIMVPPVVLLLPMFVLMVNVQLINKPASVIAFYVCLMTPFTIFFLCSFFRSIPGELIEAAVVDGASPLRSLWSVVLPLSRAALLTVAIVNIIWAWNELLIALVFLQGESSRTLMAGLTLLQGRYVTNQPLVLAVACISILPVAGFYVVSQRAFVRGLTAGIGK